MESAEKPVKDETELFLLTLSSHGLAICGIFGSLQEAQEIAQWDENERVKEWNADLWHDQKPMTPIQLQWQEYRPGRWSGKIDEGQRVHAYFIRKLTLGELLDEDRR